MRKRRKRDIARKEKGLRRGVAKCKKKKRKKREGQLRVLNVEYSVNHEGLKQGFKKHAPAHQEGSISEPEKSGIKNKPTNLRVSSLEGREPPKKKKKKRKKKKKNFGAVRRGVT